MKHDQPRSHIEYIRREGVSITHAIPGGLDSRWGQPIRKAITRALDEAIANPESVSENGFYALTVDGREIRAARIGYKIPWLYVHPDSLETLRDWVIDKRNSVLAESPFQGGRQPNDPHRYKKSPDSNRNR